MLRRLFWRFRIQSILLLSFFILNVSLLAILGTVSYRAAADEITHGAALSSLSTLSDAGQRMGLRLGMVEDAALSISMSGQLELILEPHADAWSETQAIEQARQLLNPYGRYPEIAGAHLIVHGWLVAPDHNGGLGIISDTAVRQKDWYVPAARFDSGWLGLHTNTIYPNSPDAQVVTYVRKVYHAFSTETSGVIALDVRLKALNDVIQGGVGHGPLFITGPAGEWQYQLSGGAVDAHFMEQMRRQLASPEAGYTRVELGARPALLLSTAVIHDQLRLVQLVPVDDVTSGLEKVRWAFLGGGLACVAISLLLAWALARSFVQPLTRLADAMKAVGNGNLSVRVPVEHGNEFGALEFGFNHMGEHLEQLVADVKEVNRRKRRAELEALQAQINPHFLYNTLDMINWMAIIEDKPNISEAVILLARFFRLGLSKGDTMVPLRQELEHLRTYIRLQQIRFKGSFAVVESFPPDLLAYKVPKIVLQPFVENALGHAFADRGGQGTITLSGVRRDDRLILTVADDGSGMASGAVPDPQRVGTGYGIRNVHERIQMNYGPEFGVTIDSELAKGTTVTITLPLISDEGGGSGVVSHAGGR